MDRIIRLLFPEYDIMTVIITISQRSSFNLIYGTLLKLLTRGNAAFGKLKTTIK